MNTEQNFNSSTSPAIEAMQCYAQPSIQLFNCDNSELMANLDDESVDVILTDPPYLYLKNQKLERPFDERSFFSECKRVLTKDGFIVLFGRGTSFYRWNNILADLGFEFKEEIIWNKGYTSSPLMRISRVHETISISCKGKSAINKVKVPYMQMKQHNIGAIIQDVNRLKSVLNNEKSMNILIEYLSNKKVKYDGDYVNSTTITSGKRRIDRNVAVMMQLDKGLNEKTIIKQVRDHYTSIHPTQKPVRLLERLLALVIPQDKTREQITILDPFGGSFSTMEAVYNLQMKGISCEIDKEYFEAGKERIEKLPPRQADLFD